MTLQTLPLLPAETAAACTPRELDTARARLEAHAARTTGAGRYAAAIREGSLDRLRVLNARVTGPAYRITARDTLHREGCRILGSAPPSPRSALLVPGLAGLDPAEAVTPERIAGAGLDPARTRPCPRCLPAR